MEEEKLWQENLQVHAGSSQAFPMKVMRLIMICTCGMAMLPQHEQDCTHKFICSLTSTNTWYRV